jgi:ribonuclease P protein component
MPLSFRKSQRIVSEGDFGRVLSYKCFVCKGMLRLYSAPNEIGSPRFGVSVSKSCGNAVMRNRLKRLGREAFRRHQHEIGASFDYILIFTRKKPKISLKNRDIDKKKPSRMQYKDIEPDFLAMVRMLGKKMG